MTFDQDNTIDLKILVSFTAWIRGRVQKDYSVINLLQDLCLISCIFDRWMLKNISLYDIILIPVDHVLLPWNQDDKSRKGKFQPRIAVILFNLCNFTAVSVCALLSRLPCCLHRRCHRMHGCLHSVYRRSVWGRSRTILYT